MFIGEYTHTLDDKKRIALPSKFRKALGRKIIVTQGLDNCLFCYVPSEWTKIAQQIGALGMAKSDTRGFNRFMFAGAAEVEVDKSGRVLIPENLRRFAEVKEKVVFAGVYNRIEIWDEVKWQTYKQKVSKGADDMAEKLGSVGAL